jgi:hypothetical protein
MSPQTLRSLSIAAAALVLVAAAEPRRTLALDGVDALPDGAAKVTGRLVAMPSEKGEMLDFVFMRRGDTKPITHFDTELTKQLHVIAVGDDFRTFLHDHVTRAAQDGHFRLTLNFPHPGLYHLYADAVPSGLGQQVLRFDLPVGTAVAAPQGTKLQPTGLSGRDGRYSVRFDALDLAAGQESLLTLHIDKEGKPAADLHPFLGVAAHAVLIRQDDLLYVHVHAVPAESRPSPAMRGMEGMAGMPGMAAPALPAGARVAPTLSLHVTPPRPGIYALWIQFIGGREVRTVPFVLAVK